MLLMTNRLNCMNKKNIQFIFFTAFIALFILPLPGCKKYHLKKLEHRWQLIEMPIDDTIEIWSFGIDGKIYAIVPNGTTEDTIATGNYEMLSFDRVRIAGFEATFNATWKVAKNNGEVMILTTKDLGGLTERDFINVDASN